MRPRKAPLHATELHRGVRRRRKVYSKRTQEEEESLFKANAVKEDGCGGRGVEREREREGCWFRERKPNLKNS